MSVSITIDEYALHEEIGHGQYGKVYKAHKTRTNELAAIKVVPSHLFREDEKLEEFTMNEI
jgi:serine/threonine-protein kinase ULK/ATG1